MRNEEVVAREKNSDEVDRMLPEWFRHVERTTKERASRKCSAEGIEPGVTSDVSME